MEHQMIISFFTMLACGPKAPQTETPVEAANVAATATATEEAAPEAEPEPEPEPEPVIESIFALISV